MNALLDCALPKPQWNNLAHPSPQDQESGTRTAIPPESRTRPATWANVATQSLFHTLKPVAKPSLAQPLCGVCKDPRLMIQLGENTPHRKEHPFILQKRANLVLPPNVIVGKVAHNNSGLALIPLPGTKLEPLEENRVQLAQAYGAPS